MRLSNKRKIPIYTFIQNLLLVGIILGVTAFFVERYKIDFLGWESYLLLIIPVAMGSLYWTRGKQIFEYDSDGETLTINNYSIVPFFKDQKKVRELSARKKQLEESVELYKEYKKAYTSLNEAVEILYNEKDEEMRELAKMQKDESETLI